MEQKIIKVENIKPVLKRNIKARQNPEINKISKRFLRSVKIANNKFLRTLTQIPIISRALKFEKGFTAVIPKNFLEGLKNGTYKIMQGKDGSLISIIQDVETGKIIYWLRSC